MKKVLYTDEVETHALDNVNLEIRKGEYVAIAGPSGCGKSALLSILGLLDTPTDGMYALRGEPVTNLKAAQRDRNTGWELRLEPLDTAYFGGTRQTLVLLQAAVALINEAMARRFWPDEDPIGRHITLTIVPDERPRQIVGVVGDTALNRFDRESVPMMCVPHGQQPLRYWAPYGQDRLQMTFIQRLRANPETVTAAVGKTVADVDPAMPIARVQMLDDQLAAQIETPRFYMMTLALFGGFATLLALFGIYGVITYSVARRTREVAIRMALGASDAAVVGLVLRQAALLTALGIGDWRDRVDAGDAVSLRRALERDADRPGDVRECRAPVHAGGDVGGPGSHIPGAAPRATDRAGGDVAESRHTPEPWRRSRVAYGAMRRSDGKYARYRRASRVNSVRLATAA